MAIRFTRFITKAEVVRMAFSQIVHHRAQLGVFLRLLDVPIPGSYGPSADETNSVNCLLPPPPNLGKDEKARRC